MILSILLLSFAVTVISFWTNCCYYGSYGSYGSLGYTSPSYYSYSPTYSSYSSYPSYSPYTGGYTIWYPDALEYVNRRWREYYDSQGHRTTRVRSKIYSYPEKYHKINSYPERNHLYVRPYVQKSHPPDEYTLTSIPPPPPPPDSSVRPPAPPMVFPDDSSPEDSNSVEDSDGGYGLQKKVVENNSHEDAEEVEGPRPIPLNRASATERSRKGTGIPAPPPTPMNAGLISSQSVAARGTIDDVQGKNDQLARQPVKIRPTASKDSRIDPNPPDFRRLRLPGEDDEPSDRDRRGRKKF